MAWHTTPCMKNLRLPQCVSGTKE